MTMWTPHIDEAQSPPYVAIADALASDVAAGRLRPGDRLPTHRDLAERLGVAIGTVTRAYREAERRGLVRGEVGRGTFVGGAPSPGLALCLLDETPGAIIDLSCNYPLYAADPDLAGALRELGNAGDLQQLLRYQAHAGTRRHREAGAAWAARYGMPVDPDCVLVCNGAQHAMAVVFSAIAEPGDLILAEALTYPGLKAVANMLHLRLQPVAMDEQGLIPEALASACRQRKARALYLMPTVHNPTASTMPESRRREMARIAAKHDLFIVEDDVHRLLSDDPPPTVSSLVPERSFLIAGVSKYVAGGLRVGFVVSPPEAVERLAHNIWATCWMVAPLTAELAAKWIEDGTAEAALQRKRSEAKVRQDLTRKLLHDATYHSAPHAFHIWLELPAEWDSAPFAVEARRRGVAVTPADAFMVANGAVPRAVRVCLGAVDTREQLEAGLKLLDALLDSPPGTCPALV